MCSTDPRKFKNNFKDTEEVGDQEFSARLTALKEELISLIVSNGIRESRSDPSVYTGLSGIALLLKKLGKEDDAIELLEKAKMLSSKKPRVTFLCGAAGPLALLAVLRNSEEDLEQLLGIEQYLTSLDMPDELLYGRIGYLYALLYVENNFRGHEKLENTIRKVVNIVIKSGQEGSRRWKSRSPLMYEWHEKKYFGAAHGLVGILFILLQAGEKYLSKEVLMNIVKPSLDYLKDKMFKSGNLPSSHNNENDKLIHWCHGAPGSIHLFLKAYQIFQSQEYLEIAIKSGEVIWQRGLLKKGYGLCHGIAGNAYGFLALYQTTNDIRHLRRAKGFCQFIFDYGNHDCRNPDRPYSLFEGMSGTVYFLDDMEKGTKEAKFPGFYV